MAPTVAYTTKARVLPMDPWGLSSFNENKETNETKNETFFVSFNFTNETKNETNAY